MVVDKWVFTASAKWQPLVRAGRVVLNEKANRLIWARGSRKFVSALVPSHDLTMELARAPLAPTGLQELIKLAPALQTVAPALEALQVVSAIGAAASVANLAISVAGFAAVLARLQRIEGKLDEMLVTLRGDLADLAGKLDDVAMATLLAGRDSLERSLAATAEPERLESARRARDRFQDCRMASLALWRRTVPWLNPAMNVATVLELQGRYVASAIGELQAAFILGDAGAFRHVARTTSADVRAEMMMSPVSALRVRTDAALKGLSKDNFQLLAGEVCGIPSLATQLRAAGGATTASANRLADFEDDADLPELLGAPGHEILRAMRDAPGLDVYALGHGFDEDGA